MIDEKFIKSLEKSFQQTANKNHYLFARLDGRAFHNFTKGLSRPFDQNLYNLFRATSEFLFNNYNPNLMYFQSDEISLVWKLHDETSEFPFGGKYQKLNSHLAASASAYFNKHLPDFLPAKANYITTFDCRIFECSRSETALSIFKWRQKDALKNAVSMAATSYGSHKQVLGLNTDQRISYLTSLGIDFYSLPTEFRHGTFLAKRPKTLINADGKEYFRTEIYVPFESIMSFSVTDFENFL